MAPPHRLISPRPTPPSSDVSTPAPPPALVDDLIGEILLRLPPDQPACLFHASIVCKAWRRLLFDRAFLRRYRDFHRAPPLLGFFHNLLCSSRFVSTAAESPFPPTAFDCSWVVLDCRHGRALVHTLEPYGLVVWDPITGHQQRLPAVPSDPYNHLSGAVLCAVDGCDHLHCRGGPFRVVFAAAADEEFVEEEGATWASVYSSETGAWTSPASIQLGPVMDSHDVVGPSLLAGDALYFILEDGHRILKYDFGGNALSVIIPPFLLRVGNMVLITSEDGGLGVAGVVGYRLHLWSWRPRADGAPRWVRYRVIELDMMISIGIGDPETRLQVVGFAEGADTIFVSANAGIFTLELKKSSRVRKVAKKGIFDAIYSYVRFYTPDYAIGRLPPPARMQ